MVEIRFLVVDTLDKIVRQILDRDHHEKRRPTSEENKMKNISIFDQTSSNDQ